MQKMTVKIPTQVPREDIFTTPGHEIFILDSQSRSLIQKLSGRRENPEWPAPIYKRQ